MKINYRKISPTYEINKQMIHNIKEAKTRKTKDNTQYTILSPIVPVKLAKNLILSNDLLSTCIETLAQDLVLNKINITNINGENINHDFWNRKNIYQLYLAVQDRIGYGYGALELIYNENNELTSLKQISAETIDIQVKTNNNEKSYYARYINGTDHFQLKLSRYDYTPEDDTLPTCLWLGGGKESEFYDIPIWIPSFNKISANQLLDELNNKKINEGNLISGILTVLSPPMTKQTLNEDGELETVTGGEQINNRLKEQMDNAGVGWMVLHLEQLTHDLPLDVKYIPITEQNYDYLENMAENCDNSILRDFKIPKVRLMIDDVKESMNSSKTDAIWEIYTKELVSQQIPYEATIDDFNFKYFDLETNTDIETPIFSDKKQIEIQSTIQLFDNSILTLGQAILNIKKYYPDLNIDINPDDPLFNERYYHGQILGISNYERELDNQSAEELYAFFNESNE